MTLDFRNISSDIMVTTGTELVVGIRPLVTAQRIDGKAYIMGRLEYTDGMQVPDDQAHIRIYVPEYLRPPAVLSVLGIHPIISMDLYVGRSSTTKQRYPGHGLLMAGSQGEHFMRFWAGGYSGGPERPVSFTYPQPWEEGCALRFQGWWELP